MRSTHPKATSISTGLAAALDAQHTKTAHVIHATGDIKVSATHCPYLASGAFNFHLMTTPFFQATPVVSCGSWEVFPSVQCNEDGPCPSWTPLGGGETLRWGPLLPRVRGLPG